jgi:UDP-N-acetylmuramoyl-tripeptide--D-alanyl-D-alanine ligase
MNPLTVAEISRAVDARESRTSSSFPAANNIPGAVESSAWDDSSLVQTICTDSRAMKPKALFIALRGERFDGHRFLDLAASTGAVAAMVDHQPEKVPPGLRLIEVVDTRAAMGKLAAHVRRHLRGKVIAVAGSNGKTSTKYLIHAALAGKLSGSISPKSFNNDIGVPLSIFPAEVVQDYLVLEIGTNHPGEIAPLADIAQPDIAVITNCSAEHLEGLGDLAGVRRENASVIDGMNRSGLLIVNGDDAELLQAVSRFKGRRLSFGFSPRNDLWVSSIACSAEGIRFSINNETQEWFVPMLGRHTAINALAAIAIGREMDLSDREIADNLKTARGPDMRLQLQEFGDIRVLNDAYNANPASMKAALQTLMSLPTPGRRIAVLGDMRELGDATEPCHREIGRFIGDECAPNVLACVGVAARTIAQAAMDRDMDAHRVSAYPDAAAAALAIVPQLRPGDLILLKGSRTIGLEAIAKEISEQFSSGQTISTQARAE